MKDEETFEYVVFNYRRPNLTEFMDFFEQFRQHLNSWEPSEIVPIISYLESISAHVGQLLPNHDELDIPNFQRLVYGESGEFEDDAMQEAAERGYGAFLPAIWIEYGKPKLYLLARAHMGKLQTPDDGTLDQIVSDDTGSHLRGPLDQHYF
ncbi:hypothetical protein NPIL_29251 [Nephila pilipes]|uniref:Uncharacterized protein n=1 Tax=Nephila pilipes TaxID=299642 RepID=A0A8X6UQW2_NEPPI|nr:hypothetical protein NPIL_29251 [Nephila pilipes]